MTVGESRAFVIPSHDADYWARDEHRATGEYALGLLKQYEPDFINNIAPLAELFLTNLPTGGRIGLPAPRNYRGLKVECPASAVHLALDFVVKQRTDGMKFVGTAEPRKFEPSGLSGKTLVLVIGETTDSRHPQEYASVGLSMPRGAYSGRLPAVWLGRLPEERTMELAVVPETAAAAAYARQIEDRAAQEEQMSRLRFLRLVVKVAYERIGEVELKQGSTLPAQMVLRALGALGTGANGTNRNLRTLIWESNDDGYEDLPAWEDLFRAAVVIMRDQEFIDFFP